MTVEELKQLCEESLKLYYDIKIETIKIEGRRTVLFRMAEKKVIKNNKKLEKIEADLHRVSGVFETDVKTLKDVIWSEISIQKNTYLAIQPVDKILKEGKDEHNSYGLFLCKTLYSIPIIQFESCEDCVACENTKINLLEEGFIRSVKFKTRVEELERNIPGFQELLWGIVENNLKTKFENEEEKNK